MGPIPVDGQVADDIGWYLLDMPENLPSLVDVQDADDIGILARSLYFQECLGTQVIRAGQLGIPAEIGASTGSSIRVGEQLAIPAAIGASRSSSSGLGEWLRQLSLCMSGHVDPHSVRKLANLAQKPDNRLLIANTEGILDGLVRQLSHSSNGAVQSHAARALASLAIHPHVKTSIGQMPTALSTLVQLLHRGINVSVKENAAKAVVSLTTTTSENRLIVAQLPGALTYLTELLTNDQQPDMQLQAANAFRNLAYEDQIQKRIAEWPGVLEGLAHILSVQDVDPAARSSAGKALLALTEKTKNCVILDDFQGACQALVALVRYGIRGKGQLLAAKVLRNLARRHENKFSIIRCPDALEGLERLLHDSDEAGQLGVEVLRNIIAPDTSMVIWGSPVQHCVVDLLFKDSNPNLQTQAAKEIEDLTRVSDLGFISASFPRALEGLERLLHNHSNLDGQQQAALAVTAIAATENTGVAAMLVPRFLPSLVDLLNKDGDTVQKIALRALTRLAQSSDHESVPQLASDRERMVQLFKSKVFSPCVQELFERTLWIFYTKAQYRNDAQSSAQRARLEEPGWREGRDYDDARSPAKRVRREDPGWQ